MTLFPFITIEGAPLPAEHQLVASNCSTPFDKQCLWTVVGGLACCRELPTRPHCLVVPDPSSLAAHAGMLWANTCMA